MARLHADRQGTVTVEFVVLMVCILVGCIAGWRLLGTNVLAIIGE